LLQGSPVFYDNWVARDINGTALENAPFEEIFHDGSSSMRFQQHLPVQVQSCWNGIAVLDPAPFYQPNRVRFRMARIAEGECSASECSLICNDYWEAGYGRILMVPRVKLAYDGVRVISADHHLVAITRTRAILPPVGLTIYNHREYLISFIRRDVI
jgi:Cryptococcal mannosyltransferase 1